MIRFILRVSAFCGITVLLYSLSHLLFITLGIKPSTSHIPIIGRDANCEETFYRSRPACFAQKDSSVLLQLKTDRFGLINSTNVYSPDILLIGDSYTSCHFLGSENTLANRLKQVMPDLEIMSLGIIAHSDLRFYNHLIQSQSISKPKIIVLEIVERNLRHWGNLSRNQTYSIWKDRIGRFIQLSGFPPATVAEHCDLGNRYFLNQSLSRLAPQYLNTIVEKCFEIQTSFSSDDIELFFMVVPDPENAFRAELGLEGSNVVRDFNKTALKTGVNTIDIVDLMVDNREDFYLYDDSHWSTDGVNAVATALAKQLGM